MVEWGACLEPQDLNVETLDFFAFVSNPPKSIIHSLITNRLTSGPFWNSCSLHSLHSTMSALWLRIFGCASSMDAARPGPVMRYPLSRSRSLSLLVKHQKTSQTSYDNRHVEYLPSLHEGRCHRERLPWDAETSIVLVPSRMCRGRNSRFEGSAAFLSYNLFTISFHRLPFNTFPSVLLLDLNHGTVCLCFPFSPSRSPFLDVSWLKVPHHLSRK